MITAAESIPLTFILSNQAQNLFLTKPMKLLENA